MDHQEHDTTMPAHEVEVVDVSEFAEGHVFYWNTNKLRVILIMIALTCSCFLACGTCFSIYNLQNVLQGEGLYLGSSSYGAKMQQYITASGGLNAWGSAVAGLFLPIFGSGITFYGFCTAFIVSSWCMYKGISMTHDNMVFLNSFMCFSFFEAMTNIVTEPFAHFFNKNNQKWFFTYLSAIFSLSSLPFMFIQWAADASSDPHKTLKNGFLGFVICVTIFGSLAALVYPFDTHKTIKKHDKIHNPEFYASHYNGLKEHPNSAWNETFRYTVALFKYAKSNDPNENKYFYRGLQFWFLTCAEVCWQLTISLYCGNSQAFWGGKGVANGHDLNSITTASSWFSALLGLGVTCVLFIWESRWTLSSRTYANVACLCMPFWYFIAYFAKGYGGQMAGVFFFYLTQNMWFSSFYSFCGQFFRNDMYGPLICVWCTFCGLACVLLGFCSSVDYSDPSQGVYKYIWALLWIAFFFGICTWITHFFHMRKNGKLGYEDNV